MASDSFKSFRSNSSSKSTKQAIRKCVGVAAATDSSSSSSSSDSEPDAEMKSPPSKRKKPLTIWKKKIRVICTDPDATESSSNEEEEEEVEDVILPKRLVREILIPSDCCAFPSISESSGSDRLCHNSNGINYLQAKTEEIPVCMKKEERLICRDPGMGKNVMAMMPDCAKKSSSSSSSRRANAHKASAAGKCNGARQRQRRKWSAEIRDPRKGIRIWLGTCYSFEEEVAKTCDSASSRKIDCRPQSQMEILPDSELSPYPCSNARHASDSVHLSDHKDAGRSSFLDCPNAEEEEEEVFGLIKSSSIKENMAPISSCYSGFGSLSPSSVLENAAPDDCQSPNFLNADQKVSNCADAYIDESSSAVSTGMQSDLVTSNMVDQIMANSGPMHSQLKLDSGTFAASNSLLSASSYPLLEEMQYYGDFSQIFNVSRSYSEPLEHHLDVEIFANDGFSDVDFDNETETLAWINVAEV